MATYIWGVLCRRAIVDQPTNSVSYIDMLEGLLPPRLPVPAPLIIAATLWRREEGDRDTLEVRARVESPDGVTLASDSVVLHMEPRHKRGRINIGLAGYELSSSGRHEFVIEQRLRGQWREAARLPFDIEPRSDETAVSAPSFGAERARRSGTRRATTQRAGGQSTP
jgi:hypothetical protein